MTTTVSTLFLDIGGVLLTNGWDRKARQLAAESFGLDLEEMNERHHLTFGTYEVTWSGWCSMSPATSPGANSRSSCWNSHSHFPR